MSTNEPIYSAKVTRQYDEKDPKKNDKIQDIVGYDKQKIKDTDFDKVLNEAYKLYEGETFTGSPIDVNYMSKDAFIENGDMNGSYQKIEASKMNGIFLDKIGRTSQENTYGKPLLQAGLALIANRTMDCSRMFSYPRTYLIFIEDLPRIDFPKPNIRDYQRIILVQTSWDEDSKSIYDQILIVDLASYSIEGSNANKLAIPCNVYQFDLLSLNYYYTITKSLTLNPTKIIQYNYKYVSPPKISTENLLGKYFSNKSEELFELKETIRTTFKLTDILSNSTTALKTENQVYIHPIRELHLATLYIVDYYSRNREPPSHQVVGNTHNVLLYICNNMEKIKKVFEAAIYLGFLVTQLPVDEQQHLMFVMNTRLDGEKFKAISEMIEKTSQKK